MRNLIVFRYAIDKLTEFVLAKLVMVMLYDMIVQDYPAPSTNSYNYSFFPPFYKLCFVCLTEGQPFD